MKVTGTTLAIALAFLVSVVGCLTWLIIAGKNTETLISFLTLTIFPVFLQLTNRTKLEQVQHQTNGALSSSQQQISDLTDKVATMVPVEALKEAQTQIADLSRQLSNSVPVQAIVHSTEVVHTFQDNPVPAPSAREV